MIVIPDFPDRKSWLTWRHQGIGSSDASIIMDVSRFKSREELRVDKSQPVKDEDDSNSFIKDRGNRVETFVRVALSDKHNTEYLAMNCMHDSFEFMRASLDGISKDHKTIIEIKLLTTVNPQKPNYETEGYKKFKAAQQGKVPDEYYPQVMHQLMITRAERCFFVGYKDMKGQPPSLEGNLAIVEVLPDKEYFKHLASKEFEFWYQVSERKQSLKELE